MRSGRTSENPQQPNKRKQCRNCGKKYASRPRQLCYGCYVVPRIREKYPADARYYRHEDGDFNGPARLPEYPTQALGGTAEKIAVLAQRAARHEQLFHPEDAPGCVLQRANRCPCVFQQFASASWNVPY